MNKMNERTLNVGGVETFIRTIGDESHPIICFLHGGEPGLSPYCGGGHIWGEGVLSLADRYRVIIPDLLGFSATGAGDKTLNIEEIGQHLLSLLDLLEDQQPVHFIGHDLGGLIGLWCAITHPHRVASLSIVSSLAAAPTGDGISDITLLSPPQPLWTRQSQAWAFDRLSYSHQHIDTALLDGAEAAAAASAHRQLTESMLNNSEYATEFKASIGRVKSLFFKASREEGVQVPVQVICSQHDPLVSVEQSAWLFRILAERQRHAHLHVLNRSGNFPFREEPVLFCSLLDGFIAGLQDSKSSQGRELH